MKFKLCIFPSQTRGHPVLHISTSLHARIWKEIFSSALAINWIGQLLAVGGLWAMDWPCLWDCEDFPDRLWPLLSSLASVHTSTWMLGVEIVGSQGWYISFHSPISMLHRDRYWLGTKLLKNRTLCLKDQKLPELGVIIRLHRAKARWPRNKVYYKKKKKMARQWEWGVLRSTAPALTDSMCHCRDSWILRSPAPVGFMGVLSQRACLKRNELFTCRAGAAQGMRSSTYRQSVRVHKDRDLMEAGDEIYCQLAHGSGIGIPFV